MNGTLTFPDANKISQWAGTCRAPLNIGLLLLGLHCSCEWPAIHPAHCLLQLFPSYSPAHSTFQWGGNRWHNLLGNWLLHPYWMNVSLAYWATHFLSPSWSLCLRFAHFLMKGHAAPSNAQTRRGRWVLGGFVCSSLQDKSPRGELEYQCRHKKEPSLSAHSFFLQQLCRGRKKCKPRPKIRTYIYVIIVQAVM